MTNDAFAQALGIHFSYASRLRSGQRLPSVELLYKISKHFDIPLEELHRAHKRGAESFGRLLRKRVFS